MIRYVVCLGICAGRVLAHFKENGPPSACGWNGPGGGIREGETPEQAAAREWNEEVTGWTSALQSDDFHEVGREEYGNAEGGAEVVYLATVVSWPPYPPGVDGCSAILASPMLLPMAGSAQDFIKMSIRAVKWCSATKVGG